MARATKATPAPAAVEEDEYPQGHYMEKEPTQVHENFVDYVADEVGYEADLKTVQLVIALYQKFQKTPEQQEYNRLKKEASAAAAEERDQKRAEREKAAVEKPVARASARKTAKADSEEEAEPAAAPARAARGTRTAKAAPAARSSRRRSVPAADDIE
jgi:hypothetical protein